jgi:hypothetical protein
MGGGGSGGVDKNSSEVMERKPHFPVSHWLIGKYGGGHPNGRRYFDQNLGENTAFHTLRIETQVKYLFDGRRIGT